ncbi:hypothetical protein AB0K18_40525 [Nonomuraea sp. NPDC049421]|uniref:hypothetical protein n=1 Tax=Nonomuraea sp. NPDC049421 TaxID=3155275 RepID=UPI00344698BC
MLARCRSAASSRVRSASSARCSTASARCSIASARCSTARRYALPLLVTSPTSTMASSQPLSSAIQLPGGGSSGASAMRPYIATASTAASQIAALRWPSTARV